MGCTGQISARGFPPLSLGACLVDEARLCWKQRDAVLWEDVAGKLASRGLRREVLEIGKGQARAKVGRARGWAVRCRSLRKRSMAALLTLLPFAHLIRCADVPFSSLLTCNCDGAVLRGRKRRTGRSSGGRARLSGRLSQRRYRRARVGGLDYQPSRDGLVFSRIVDRLDPYTGRLDSYLRWRRRRGRGPAAGWGVPASLRGGTDLAAKSEDQHLYRLMAKSGSF